MDSPANRLQCMEIWGGNQWIDTSMQVPGLDLWVFSRPHGDARGGGDVHYLSSCASGRITRLLVADVSGHGETAARVAETLRDLMRKNINQISQSRFVESLNAEFERNARTGVFATAVVATYFCPTRTLQLSNAGHPPPLIYRAASGRWEVHGSPDGQTPRRQFPLGVDERESYTVDKVPLAEHDLALIYTDALPEARDAQGRLLQSAGLLARLRELEPDPVETLMPRLLERISREFTGNLLGDDVTLLLCRASNTGTRLQDNLLAPFRLLREVLGGYDRPAGKSSAEPGSA